MFGSNVTVKGGPSLPSFQPIDQIDINYTGKNINATNGSRTANTANLTIGDVLVLDPYGFDSGIGTDFANPTTGHLANFAVVVTYVPADSVLGGPCKAVPLSKGHCVTVAARTKANMTAGTTVLALTNDTDGTANLRHLVATSTDPTTPLLTLTPRAIAAETYDSSTTAAVKLVMPGN